MSRIARAELGAIYDSRGQPTVEATIALDTGASGRAGAPSGASTGAHEVRAFPAGGVPEALGRFREEVAPRLVGLDPADQEGFDRLLVELDGSPDLSRLGGNSTTALSVAVALARADDLQRPLWEVLKRPGADGRRFPAIVGNCLNGGRHAVGGPEIQEFLAFADGPTIDASIRAALSVHARIGRSLQRRFPGAALGRGDEGGWVAPLDSWAALDLLKEACAAARDELKIPVHPGVDFAASEFFRDGRYRYRDRSLAPEGQIALVADLAKEHGLRYVEDPFDQEAFDAFRELTARLGGSAEVVGDDLYATQAARVRSGLEIGATNSVLIKVNQAGTLSGTFAAVEAARAHGASTIASHRSGETPDAWLAHLALGIGARGIKTGLLGGERVAKLNELLRLGRPRSDDGGG